MGALMDEIINRRAGLRLVDEDGYVDDDAIAKLSEILDDLIKAHRITLYNYNPRSCSVHHYLSVDIKDGWTHLAISSSTDGELVGCKKAYFTDGDGKGLEIIGIHDLLELDGVQSGDETSLAFESIF